MTAVLVWLGAMGNMGAMMPAYFSMTVTYRYTKSRLSVRNCQSA